MTKDHLIKQISAETKISKDTTTKIVESLLDCVKSSIANGEDVTLRGFGTFQNVLRHQKNFHYAPGKYRLIPEHYVVKLKFSNEVNNLIK